MPTPWSRCALAALLAVPLLLVSTAAAQDAAEAYRAALACEAAGRPDEARAAYERVLALDPEHRAARRALGYEEVDGYWLRGDELLRAKGFVHHDGRWMTAVEFADATRPARASEAQREGEQRVLACLALIASEEEEQVAEGERRLATLPPAHRLAPLARSLRCEPASLRVFACGALGRLGDPLAVPALLKRTIDDPAEDVRRAAAQALAAIDAPGTIVPLGRALWSRHADVRVRAAEALGRIGDPDAAAWLVLRWEGRSGAFPRCYFTQVEQVSFIQDFDVEVASTSFIADPIVGVLQQGVVQYVRVLATEQTWTSVERVAYEEALRRIRGE